MLFLSLDHTESKKSKSFIKQFRIASEEKEEKVPNQFQEMDAASLIDDKVDEDESEIEIERMFQVNGLTYFPIEKESMVENAMESGQTVVLTGN